MKSHLHAGCTPHAGCAPIGATGLFNNGESAPRDAQSIAFFNQPEME
jgi:hypothetical protein